jgi:hypothetical protein
VKFQPPPGSAPIAFVVAGLLPAFFGCGPQPANLASTASPAGSNDPSYKLVRVFEVEGRQGVATDGELYYVSGSKELFVYSKEGELLRSNLDPFAALERPANHIGDIDVHAGEIFAGIENFSDGRGTDIQIAIFDAESLEYLRSIAWEPDSGQVEVSAVAVDAERNAIWMTDWVDGRYIYRYDLDTGEYAGKVHLRPVPQWQQGVTAHDGVLLITADDGDADLGEADNLWRVDPGPGASASHVEHEHEFTEFRRAGEIEGVTFDEAAGELVVLSNRGARIVLGMPSGFYPGYDREIHEIYVFSLDLY